MPALLFHPGGQDLIDLVRGHLAEIFDFNVLVHVLLIHFVAVDRRRSVFRKDYRGLRAYPGTCWAVRLASCWIRNFHLSIFFILGIDTKKAERKALPAVRTSFAVYHGKPGYPVA